MNMNFSFCIVLYKSADVLEPMLQTLSTYIESGDEILLFDNCPESGDLKIVKKMEQELGLKLKYITSEKNLGFGNACNLMVLQTVNPRLVFLNPDTQTLHFDRTIHKPNVIIGPYVIYPNGNRQSSSGASRSVGRELKMKWLRIFEYNESGDDLEYISGVAFSIDRKAYQELEGFDEEFFMYYEDVDLCIRARAFGIKCEISEKWRINHVGGSSANKIKTETAIRNFKSAHYFHKKYNHNLKIFVVASLLDSILRIPYYIFRGDFNSAKSFLNLSKYLFTKRPL